MQFPVPQFIDVEDTIIGSLTLKQFAVVAVAGLIVLALFKLLGLGFFFYLLAVPIAIVAAIIAFASYNGRKIYNFIPVILKFLKSDKTLVFQQRRPDEQIIVKPLNNETIQALSAAQAPKPTEEPVQSRLRRIALALDQRNQEEADAIRRINKNPYGQR